MLEFKEVVTQSWAKPVSTANKVSALHIKLIHGGTACITQQAKAGALEDFYSKQLGISTTRQNTLNWDRISKASN
jgi:hypothetical protein